jgi:hypothetical protein
VGGRDLVGVPYAGVALDALTERDDVETPVAGVGLEGTRTDALDGPNLHPDLLGQLAADRPFERVVAARRRLEFAAGQPENARRVVLVGTALDQEVLVAASDDAVDVDDVLEVVRAVSPPASPLCVRLDPPSQRVEQRAVGAGAGRRLVLVVLQGGLGRRDDAAGTRAAGAGVEVDAAVQGGHLRTEFLGGHGRIEGPPPVKLRVTDP